MNLSWWHHRDAAQGPQDKLCQQEMPEPGVIPHPCLPFCAQVSAWFFTPGHLWWYLEYDLTGKE